MRHGVNNLKKVHNMFYLPVKQCILHVYRAFAIYIQWTSSDPQHKAGTTTFVN